MSQLTRENQGNFPVEGTHKRIEGKEVTPSAGNFKSNKILDKLPGHEPLDDGGVKAKGFQNLRDSTVRKGSI